MDNINGCQLNQACDFRFNSNMKSQLINLQAIEIDLGTDRTKMFEDRS